MFRIVPLSPATPSTFLGGNPSELYVSCVIRNVRDTKVGAGSAQCHQSPIDSCWILHVPYQNIDCSRKCMSLNGSTVHALESPPDECWLYSNSSFREKCESAITSLLILLSNLSAAPYRNTGQHAPALHSTFPFRSWCWPGPRVILSRYDGLDWKRQRQETEAPKNGKWVFAPEVWKQRRLPVVT